MTHDAHAWESRAFNRNQNGRDFESQVDVLAGASVLNLSAEQTAANLVQTPSAYDPASEMMNQTPGRELVLINSNLAGTDQLITDLSASDRLNSVEVVLLDAERGGIAQVNAILSARANLAAVHVLTHGSEGQIQLGNEWLNSATLQENRHSVAGWGDALTETGDFLFYGCDIAADSLGESLLNTIADLTGADVAASKDATGHASKGGDWTLEYTTGVIEKKGAVQSGTLDDWSHLLAPPVASDDSYSVDEDNTLVVDWWHTDWSRRQALTFDNSGQPDTLTDFPVLVQLNSGNMDYAQTQGDGADLRFIAADGTQLAHEIVKWDESGDSYVWVKVPQITGGSNADSIMMYYGNTAASDAQDSAGVWSSDFAAVYHLENDLNDATANANHGANSGSTNAGGQVGDGQLFDGIDDYGNLGSASSVDDIFDGGATISAWINPTSWGEGGFGRILDKADNIGTNRNGWAFEIYGGNESLLFQHGFTGAIGNWISPANSINLGQWQHVAVVFDSGSDANDPKLYINGVEQVVTEIDTPSGTYRSDADIDLTLGNYSQDTNRTFDGILDDVRISRTQRSADWIAAEHLSMTGAFVSLGGEEPAPATGGLLSNDSDADGDPLSVTLVSGPNHAQSFTLNKDGTFNYTPTANYYGSDTFTYEVSDGNGGSTQATVNLTVNSITDAPIATDDPGIFSADLLALNPLSYWRLGETAGAAADLGSSANNGTYNGGALGQPGAINGDGDTTVRFDALNTDYVAIAHSDDYLLDNGTVQLWFNADTAATGDLQHLFSKDSQGEDTGGHLSIYLNAAGRLEVRLQSDSSSYFVTSPSAVTAGQWHHVAFTFGAGGMALYLDGQSVDTNGYSGGLGTTSGDIGNHEPIAIGGGTQISDDLLLTPANQFFTGQIDEVAIVGSPLGAQAVRELFGAGRQDYTVDEENTLNVAAVEGVLINDFDVEGDPLTVTAINGSAANIGTPVTLASGARVTLNADGGFLYDPNGHFDDLSQGQTATDSFSYVANDGSTDSNPAAVSITITGVNDPPVDLQATATTAGGISLNADGGNDVYLVADNGGGLLGGLTTLTVEASFAVNTPAADNTVLLSYADGTNDEELALFLKNDGSIWFCAHSQGASHQSTANQYPQLFDGEKHHVGASWDASSGSVVFYVDGQQVESFGGYQTGRTITGGGELVFGQDQDSELGGFNTIDLFSGVLHDVRIFNDVRTAGEIAANFDQTLPSNEPGMIANWTFNDLSTGGIVVDAVSGNNLTVQHVGTGGGFTPSTPELTLEVEENSPNGTVVGTITASDPDAGDTLTYSLLDDAGGRFEILPASGVIRVADGSLLNYDSSTSHNVTVRVSDALSNTYDEVFTIQVTDLNEPPIAVADSFTVAEGTTTNLNLAANDSDPENALDLASIAIVSGPTYGSVAVNGDGTVDYTHDGTANFLDAFSYTIADNAGSPSNTVAVDLTITPQNDSPLARPDGVYLAFDGDDFIRVADDASLQMTNNVTMEAWINHNGGGTGSQLILNKEGEYEMGITADTGEIKYAIADTTDNWTWHNTGYFVTTGAWTHVAVTFDGVAGEIRTYIDGQLVDTLAQPGPMGDVYTMHNDLTIGGRGNATNQRFQGQIDEVRVWNTTRTQGEIQANMNNLLTGGEAGLAGYWRLDEAGTASVVDHSANSNAGILGGADATPTYQGYVTDEDTLLTIPALSGVLANDADEESDPLSVVAINGSGPSVGTPVVLVSGARVTLNADGSFIYDPNGQFEFLAQGETTTDTFTYVANDGSSDSNPATVTIAITGINDAPTTTGLANQNLGEDFADYTIDLKTIFADAETSDANLIYTVAGNSNIGVSIDANGIATISATTANWYGTETITFSARDESGASVDATADFIVAAVNDAPTVSAVNLGSIAEDSSLLIIQADLLTGSSDIDPDTLSAVNLAIASGSGTLTDNGGGTWTFTPTADWNGAVSFTFDVFDGTAAVANTASLTVTAVNDAPVFGGVNTGAVTEDVDPDNDGFLEASGVLTIADPDPGESNFQADTVAGTYGSLFIDAVGNWTYAADSSQTAIQQLDAGESISDVLTVTTADGTTHNVTITINGTEDTPSIGGTFAGRVEKNGSLTASGMLLITDADTGDNPIDFTDVAATPGDNGYGNFALVGGAWTYTLNDDHPAVQAMNAGETLTDTHTFTATDGSTRVVTITIGARAFADLPPIIGGNSDPDREAEEGGESTPPRMDSEPEPDVVNPAEDESWPTEEIDTAHAPTLAVSGIAPNVGQWPRYFIPAMTWAAFDETGSRPDVPATGDGRHIQGLTKALTTGAREVLAPVAAIFSSEAMDFELDRLQMQIDDYLVLKTEQGQVIIGTATGIGASVFVGYVIWALRGSSLLLGALSAMPMWRCFDPLPVLMGKNGRQEDEQGDKDRLDPEDNAERRVRDLLDSGSRDAGSNPSPGGVS